MDKKNLRSVVNEADFAVRPVGQVKIGKKEEK
jgi:hypothetical protein